MTDIIHEYFAIFNQRILRFETDKSEILRKDVRFHCELFEPMLSERYG